MADAPSIGWPTTSSASKLRGLLEKAAIDKTPNAPFLELAARRRRGKTFRLLCAQLLQDTTVSEEAQVIAAEALQFAAQSYPTDYPKMIADLLTKWVADPSTPSLGELPRKSVVEHLCTTDLLAQKNVAEVVINIATHDPSPIVKAAALVGLKPILSTNSKALKVVKDSLSSNIIAVTEAAFFSLIPGKKVKDDEIALIAETATKMAVRRGRGAAKRGPKRGPRKAPRK